jgi:hypothetical protein
LGFLSDGDWEYRNHSTMNFAKVKWEKKILGKNDFSENFS